MKVFGRLSPTFHYRQHRQSPGDSLESPGRGMPEESLELALNLEGQATTGPLLFRGDTVGTSYVGAEISAF